MFCYKYILQQLVLMAIWFVQPIEKRITSNVDKIAQNYTTVKLHQNIGIFSNIVKKHDVIYHLEIFGYCSLLCISFLVWHAQ